MYEEYITERTCDRVLFCFSPFERNQLIFYIFALSHPWTTTETQVIFHANILISLRNKPENLETLQNKIYFEICIMKLSWTKLSKPYQRFQ